MRDTQHLFKSQNILWHFFKKIFQNYRYVVFNSKICYSVVLSVLCEIEPRNCHVSFISCLSTLVFLFISTDYEKYTVKLKHV